MAPPAQPPANQNDDDLDNDNQVDGMQFAHDWVAPEDHSMPDRPVDLDLGPDHTPGH
ncbi:hypothetical protein [Kibdelosporangium aridum]